MYILIVILVLAVLLFLWGIGIYNGIIKARNVVYEALSGIDVFLKKRFDLIPNLVEVVKGYAKHESETLEKIVQWRSEKPNMTTEETLALDQKVTEALVNFRATAENYPELKADKQYQKLMGELSSIEGELANSRRYYNGAVRSLNDKIMVFPSSIIANMFNFKAETYYEIEEASQRETPKVDFS